MALPGSPHVKALVPAGGLWLVQDEHGRLIKTSLPASAAAAEDAAPDCTTLATFHSAGVSQLVPDPAGHYTVSCALDGTAWVHDTHANVGVCSQQLGSSITCMMPAANTAPSAKCCAYFTGHGDGTLRRIVRCADAWKIVQVCKPHDSSIVAVCLAPAGAHMATIASDGTAFFFAIQQHALRPIARAQLGGVPVHALWLGQEVLVACQDGPLLRVTPPLQHAHDAAGTYTCTVAVHHQPVLVPAGADEAGSEADAAARSTGVSPFHGSATCTPKPLVASGSGRVTIVLCRLAKACVYIHECAEARGMCHVWHGNCKNAWVVLRPARH